MALSIVPKIRRISAESDFFVEGNFERYVQFQGKQFGGSSSLAITDVNQFQKSNFFTCTEVGCDQRFDSLRQYDEHRFRCHSNLCSVCGKSYPSDRLLSIHLSELHDSYFAVLAKKRPSFVCLVVGCESMFWSNAERRKHLIEQHKYHPSYDFHNPKRFLQAFKKKISGKSHDADSGRTNSGMMIVDDETKRTDECAATATRKGGNVGNRAQRRAIKMQQYYQWESSSLETGFDVTVTPPTDPPANDIHHSEQTTSKSRNGSNKWQESKQDRHGMDIGSDQNLDVCSDLNDEMEDLTKSIERISVRVPNSITFGRRKQRHGPKHII